MISDSPAAYISAGVEEIDAGIKSAADNCIRILLASFPHASF
jgi:hypothetical protein